MVSIRPATRDDVERVIALRTQAFNINEHGRDSMRKEARGRGVGTTMMRELLKELRPRVPISSLYPATVPIYRSAGYGFGGVRTFWKTRLDALPHTGPLRASPFTDDDIDEVND